MLRTEAISQPSARFTCLPHFVCVDLCMPLFESCRFSSTNRTKQVARAKEAAEMGLVPLDPLEQHELQKKMDASSKVKGGVKTTERGINVPRVGRGDVHLRPRPAMIDYIPHRKGEEEIREEFDNFEIPQAPPGRPYRSADEKKDELAEMNQFAEKKSEGGTRGRRITEVLHSAPRPSEAEERSKADAAASANRPLKDQISDEIAERHDFLDRMTQLGRCDRDTQQRIQSEIADRVNDLKVLERLGGEEQEG